MEININFYDNDNSTSKNKYGSWSNLMNIRLTTKYIYLEDMN